MIAIILGVISSIVLGVAGNLLTPYVRTLLNFPPEQEDSHPPTQQEPHQDPEDIEASRARNREQFRVLAWQAYLYGTSFFFIFVALYLPLSFSAPLKGELNLAHTRLGVELGKRGQSDFQSI